MTLLTIAQAVSDETNFTRPTALTSSTDPDLQKLLRLINKIGNRLMKVFPWQALRMEQTFTGLAQEVQTGILPSDFDRFIPETFWDRTNGYLIPGPVSPVEWNSMKAGHAPAQHKFVYRGGNVSIYPVIDGGENLAFEYVSNQWVESSGGTGQSSFLADTDVARIDEDLIVYGVIFEFLESEGQPGAGSAYQKYRDRYNLLAGNDRPSAGVMSAGDLFGRGRHFNGTPGASGAGNLL